MMVDGDDVSVEVTRYSVLVGFVLIIVFVLPCVMFALLSKFFQSPDPERRSSTFRSLVSSVRISIEAREEGLHRNSGSLKKQVESDSSAYGTYGLIEIQPDALEYLEKIVTFKTKLACIETWQCYAPAALDGHHGNKRIITIRRLAMVSYADREHNMCLRAELDSLSEIPAHHLMLNLLGVCVSRSTGVLHAIMMEYPTFGSLHTFLICKRRAKVSGSTHLWGGLQLEKETDKLVFALPESSRESLSPLLDDPAIRKRPFEQPLKEPITDVDQLIFALQIGHGMKFLIDNGILHKRLSTENVLISHGFYLKLTGVDFEPPTIHQATGTSRLKRTASGRNMLKWDAPEVIDSNEFSEKSEIWRFGMTMWEVASLGDAPFSELPNRIMTEMVKKGQKPHMPDACSQQMYSLMEYCWQLNANERPHFSQVIERINGDLRSHEEASHMDLSVATSPGSSVNTPTTATSLDCSSTTYWTATTPKEMKSGCGSLKRPHPSTIPAYRRLVQRPSINSPPSTAKDQLLFVSVEDNSDAKHAVTSQEGYVETDV